MGPGTLVSRITFQDSCRHRHPVVVPFTRRVQVAATPPPPLPFTADFLGALRTDVPGPSRTDPKGTIHVEVRVVGMETGEGQWEGG